VGVGDESPQSNRGRESERVRESERERVRRERELKG
jgi:hypothetical protein